MPKGIFYFNNINWLSVIKKNNNGDTSFGQEICLNPTTI